MSIRHSAECLRYRKCRAMRCTEVIIITNMSVAQRAVSWSIALVGRFRIRWMRQETQLDKAHGYFIQLLVCPGNSPIYTLQIQAFHSGVKNVISYNHTRCFASYSCPHEQRRKLEGTPTISKPKNLCQFILAIEWRQGEVDYNSCEVVTGKCSREGVFVKQFWL